MQTELDKWKLVNITKIHVQRAFDKNVTYKDRYIGNDEEANSCRPIGG